MTDFLFDNAAASGYIASGNLMTTELNALGIGAGIISSVGGSGVNGIFNQSFNASGIIGQVWFKLGGTLTPGVNATMSIWYIASTDGGTTFEAATVAKLGRNPDIVIAFGNTAYASGDIIFAPGLIRLWSPPVKLFAVNNLQVQLPATGNILTVGAVAIRH